MKKQEYELKMQNLERGLKELSGKFDSLWKRIEKNLKTPSYCDFETQKELEAIKDEYIEANKKLRCLILRV